MPDVVMPRLSDTMEEGELSKWLKNEGDQVSKGDVLAEIETDKATMDLEAFESGILEKHLVEAGTVVAIGTPVAVIGDGSGSADAAKPDEPKAEAEDESQGEEPSKAASHNQKAEKPAKKGKAAGKADAAKDAAGDAEAAKGAGDVDGDESEGDVPEDELSAGGGDVPAKLRMSPLARKIAKDHGLDPGSITGSGPQGRVVRADVEAAISDGAAPTLASASAGASTSASASASASQKTRPTAGPRLPDADEEVPVNRIRKVTAKRLTESQAVPHFFLTSIVDVENLLAFRAEVNDSLESQGIKVSVNDLFVRAAAVALRQHPEANSSWGDDSIIRRANINIGIAVATDAGLLVPVVKNTDRKDLATIAQETVELAGKARDGKLSPDEMTGGTFSISNLGMFGIDQFTAVLNPPEAAILAVGAASPVPVLRDGELVEVPKLKITLTVDHRVMDGAVAAGFLRDLVEILEKPLRIIL